MWRLASNQKILLNWLNAGGEEGDVDAPDAEAPGQRVTRDVQEHLPVNDYVSESINLHINQESHHHIL